MTRAEQQRHRKLENNLKYGRGIFEEHWDEFVELRKKFLISKNEDPENWTINSRFLERK